MRVHLYKAICKDNGEWIEGSLNVVNEKTYINSLIGDLDDLDYGLGFREVVPETVGKYVGRPDKNGIKMFEGDNVIVRDDEEEVGAIVWDNEESLYSIECKTFAIRLGDYYSRELEIVGNIHD